MRIAHIGLASFFTEHMTYQDNQLSNQNVLDGHEVLVISNASKYADGKVVDTGYEDYYLENGIRLIRLPYRRILSRSVSEKLRVVDGLYGILEDFKPDVIMSHNLAYVSVLDVIRYKKNHPEVKFYADTHTSVYNSGRNWVSLHLQHRILYRYLTQRALPHLESYFYVGATEREFSRENYGVSPERMELFPLGGNPPEEKDYLAHREKRRKELNLASGELLLLHSGKLDALKRTKELLEAFAAVPELKAKLAIIGSIPEQEKENLQPLMEADSRVIYLGWKQSAELLEYLCASDLYCQPGSVSATLQNAVCCGCPVMTYPHLLYTEDLDYGNLLWVKTEEDMEAVFRGLAEGKINPEELREGSKRCARELLDYRTLAARLYR